MIRVIRELLGKEDLENVHRQLSSASFVDGKQTATGRAAQVKNNEQLDNEAHQEISQFIATRISENREFRVFTQAHKITAPRISRYSPGQYYGWHNDNSKIDGARTDISFTLFLSEPDSYEGGELQINFGTAVTSVKPAAGDMVIYPTQYVHQVAPLTSGTRIAAVGWVESTIRNEMQRDILAELEVTNRQVVAGKVNDDTLNNLNKVLKNLQRMWME